jgi:L-ascorbate metabolism protein UlaG (beta-lactamase superfamily)
VPDDAAVDEVGDIDVLLVPVGGNYTIDSSEAIELIKKVEPSIVIPMHFGTPENSSLGLAPLSDFLKKIGAENNVALDKLVIKPEELEEEMKVVVLKA